MLSGLFVDVRDSQSFLLEQRLFCNFGGQDFPPLSGGITTLLILVLTADSHDSDEQMLHPCHDPTWQSSEHLTAQSLSWDGLGASRQLNGSVCLCGQEGKTTQETFLVCEPYPHEGSPGEGKGTHAPHSPGVQ